MNPMQCRLSIRCYAPEAPQFHQEGDMTTKLERYAPLPLRILLGIGCVHHGWHNVVMADERMAFTWMVSQLGMTHPTLTLWIISLVSFLGGIALLTGAWVRAVSVPLAINVSAILFLIHMPSGFDFVKLTAVTAEGPQFGMPGYEVSLLYMAGFLSLHLSGAGACSVDAVRERRERIIRPIELSEESFLSPGGFSVPSGPRSAAELLLAPRTGNAYACNVEAGRGAADASSVRQQSLTRTES
jgi:putative oxidoreductase